MDATVTLLTEIVSIPLRIKHGTQIYRFRRIRNTYEVNLLDQVRFLYQYNPLIKFFFFLVRKVIKGSFKFV